MITHHTFLHNKVSIFPQHNNIKIKIHIKSRSQQTKLVLNVDFEWGKALVQLAPFHLRCPRRGGCWSWVQGEGSPVAVAAPAEVLIAPVLGQTSALPHGSLSAQCALRSSELISLCHHPGSKGRELSSVRSNSGKKKPWQFWTWSVYCTTTQLVTPTQEWAVGQSRSWNPREGGGSSHQDLVAKTVPFDIVASVTFAGCPASWGDC